MHVEDEKEDLDFPSPQPVEGFRRKVSSKRKTDISMN